MNQLEQFKAMLDSAGFEYEVQYKEATTKMDLIPLGMTPDGLESYNRVEVPDEPATTHFTIWRGYSGFYTLVTFETESGKLLDMGAWE